jgi:ribosome-binding factor A
MTDQKTERLKEAIREKAALFILQENNHTSLITVTNVLLTDDKKRANILVSVLPEHKEEAVLDFLRRKRGALRAFLEKEIRVGRIPTLDVALDMGEKNRQRIEAISEEENNKA